MSLTLHLTSVSYLILSIHFSRFFVILSLSLHPSCVCLSIHVCSLRQFSCVGQKTTLCSVCVCVCASTLLKRLGLSRNLTFFCDIAFLSLSLLRFLYLSLHVDAGICLGACGFRGHILYVCVCHVSMSMKSKIESRREGHIPTRQSSSCFSTETTGPHCDFCSTI